SRMNAIGHGDRREMDAEEALDVAARAEPLPAAGVDADDPLGLRAGEQIIVSPDDYGRVPVAGELVGLDLQRITIRRSDPRTGMLHTHFPRTGYRIDRA
ncbi:MAG: glutathione S-transferase family protein, partial [Gammaproteobacteria bacterium]